MKLFLLSLLAISSVQSLTIGYPYRSVWTYNPAITQLPIKSSVLQGYVRYLDGSGGADGVVEPIYAVRQLKYFTSDVPVQKSSAKNLQFDEINFRSWSLLQYQNLKRDIEAAKAGGSEPSAEIMEKFQALEKIVFAPNFSVIADLPEVKAIIQDYSQVISSNEAVQSSNIDTQNQGELKTYTGISNIPFVAIQETPETKQAREEHLRIYNEQIAQLRQLELEHEKHIKEAAAKTNIKQAENAKQEENAKALAELKRAEQEHFRLWNEAKLRAEQADYGSAAKTVYESAEKQQISNQNTLNLKHNQEIQTFAQTEPLKTKHIQLESSRSQNYPVDQTVAQPQQVVVRNEHSRLVDSSGTQSVIPQQVVETPEVAHAREEHLRIVNEAVAKAQEVHQQEEKQRQQRVEQSQQNIHEGSQSSISGETSEASKADNEHLRLVEEANLRAQFVEQQESKYKQQSQTPILKTQYPHEQLVSKPVLQDTPEVAKAREQHLRLVNEIKSKTNQAVQWQDQQRTFESAGIEETPEVQRAREQHLRIFNAIRSQVENEQTLKDEHKTLDAGITSKLDERTSEEERFLEMERIREAERLQREQQLLEMERIREAERLAEEKRAMEAELIRLRIEDEQRLEMERLLEMKRLQQEQEELQKLKSEGIQEIVIQDNAAFQQPQQIAFISNEQTAAKSNVLLGQQYINNPYLKSISVKNEPVGVNRLQHSSNLQQEHTTFGHSPFLKTSAVKVPSVSTDQHQHHHPQPHPVSVQSSEQSSDNVVPSARYVPSSQQPSGNKKQHYVKDDPAAKNKYYDTASSQPADTAEVLIALERATKDHLRAHEIALEQLRLARLHNPQLKDCN